MPELLAARLDALPSGCPVLVELAGRRLALVRIANDVHAVDDSCPHAGGPLSEGRVERGAVTCPYHGFVYDLATGVCLAPGRGLRVRVYATRVADGQVWIEVPAGLV